MPNEHQAATSLSFYGAAGTVTGSRYLVEHADKRVLVDCGLFQGYKQLRLRNWAPLPFDPGSIDAVVLTHAHIDHSGFLPALSRMGFRGHIYCSAATRELCEILLRDSAHLQEEDAAFANRHRTSKHTPALPLYTTEDAKLCLEQFRDVLIDTDFSPVPEVTASLARAGHILGACTVHLQTPQASILFTGDLGRAGDPLLLPPAPAAPCDYLVCESTYGDRKHPAIDPESELGDWLRPACERGGVVVIPSFAVGRAQMLLLYLARLKRDGRLPDIPVFLDSPMAVDASELYQRFSREHRLSEDERQRLQAAATLIHTPEQSKALDQRSGPMIIVSASGMATGGRVVHHLKAFMGDPRNLILLAGFQAPGTRGGALVNGATQLRIHGQDFQLRARVGQLRSSSSHADADELLAWIGTLSKPPRTTFVTHGEPAASDALRYRIEHELGWNACVPEYRDTIELAPHAVDQAVNHR